MCFFQTVAFEMYTSEPRLQGDYWQSGETDEQYRKRQIARRQASRERNIAANENERRKAGKIIAMRQPLKVADESFPTA